MSHASAEEMSHISPLKTLFAVFGALVVFTVATVAVIHVDLGPWNIVIAMAIATVKATLVALYFMHLRYDKGFARITFSASLLFLALFLAFALMDSGQYQPDIKWQETVGKAP